jgi:hypothetical protein
MNVFKKRGEIRAAELPPSKSKEELMAEYQSVATGIVQRSSLVSRIQRELGELGQQIEKLEGSLMTINAKEQEEAKEQDEAKYREENDY